MIYTTDDVCPSNLKYFKYWDKVKKRKPDLKLIAFTIANYQNQENISKSKEFKEWFEKHKDWVEIGVHSYNHLRPQECWRDDQEIWIKKALDILKPYLPEKYLYRPPGFRVLSKTEGILKKLGFAGIVYQSRIKYFSGEIVEPIFNTHCGNQGVNKIKEIHENIQ